MPLHDPHDTIVCKVFLYPANGDEPYIHSMKFSEAGAKHPYGLFTTAVDLRGSYGKYMNATRLESFDVVNQSDETKCNEGEYGTYYNTDVRLPINLSLARLLDINPERPGARPTWRGDVVVVKREEWPGPLVVGGGAHMNYLDVHPSLRLICDRFFKEWYSSDRWADLVQTENDTSTYDDLISKVLGDNPAYNPKIHGVNQKKYEKDERLINRLSNYQDKQINREARRGSCAVCNSVGKPNLMVCGGCREIKYCSKECQAADWKRHKGDCKRMPS